MDYVMSESFFARGWVEPKRVKEEYQNYLKSDKSNSFFLWQWISLEIWSRLFLD